MLASPIQGNLSGEVGIMYYHFILPLPHKYCGNTYARLIASSTGFNRKVLGDSRPLYFSSFRLEKVFKASFEEPNHILSRKTLTHCCRVNLKGEHKQTKQARCSIWSGSQLFANSKFCLEPNKTKKLHLIPLK